MKKTRRVISVALALIMALSVFAAASVSASANESARSIVLKDEFAAWGWNSGKAEANIYSEYGGEVIVNESYHNVSYDASAKTITLKNVNQTENCFWLAVSGMGNIKVKLVGNNEISYMTFTNSNVTFTGTGTLTLNPVIEDERLLESHGTTRIHWTDIPIEFTDSTCVIDKDATVIIENDKGKNNHSAKFTFSESKDIGAIFDYKGGVSGDIFWDMDEIDNSYTTREYCSCQYIETKFPADKLYYCENLVSDENYWIISNISSNINNAIVYARLGKSGGKWYENNLDRIVYHLNGDDSKFYNYSDLVDSDGVWLGFDNATPINVTFKPYGENADFSESLVSGGYAEANILSATSSSYELYTKDGSDYVLVLSIAGSYTDGDGSKKYYSGVYNSYVDGVMPPSPSKEGYSYLIFKVSKDGKNTYLSYEADTELYAESFDTSEDYQAFVKTGEKYMKDNGYEEKGVNHQEAKSYEYTMTNNTISFSPELQKLKITACKFSAIPAKTYTGKAIKPSLTVKYGTGLLKPGTDYTVSYKNNTNAGTAVATVTGKGIFTGSKTLKFTISKAANPMKVSTAVKSVKYSSVKKAKQTVKKVLTVKGNIGGVSYSKVAKGSSVNLTVSSKGYVSVAMGTKKGTYKIKVKVTAKGDSNYKMLAKTVTVTVKVK